MPPAAKGVGVAAGAAGRRQVPVAWQALEDAFENNAPEVHSYLNVETGDVIRIVDGIAEPNMHARIAGDAAYLRVDPVSSREQYRWMERFIATTEEGPLRDQLRAAIDGKGAFRRFKDVLMGFPVDRERWFVFRSERLKVVMQAWLEAHGLQAIERPEWQVPTAEDVRASDDAHVRERPRRSSVEVAEAGRQKLRDLVEALPAGALDLATEFLTFLRERRSPRTREKAREGGPTGDDDPG
jgi:hypothetical protein